MADEKTSDHKKTAEENGTSEFNEVYGKIRLFGRAAIGLILLIFFIGYYEGWWSAFFSTQT